MTSSFDISVVTTLYRSSPYVDEFYARVSKAVAAISQNYEIIFVNDGSPDDAVEKAIALHRQDAKVKVIDLSRNFGHHRAIMTGLENAKGKLVFLIDVDLEEAPELVNDFYADMQADQALDVIYGVQDGRKGKFLERIGGKVFYTVFNYMSPVKIPADFVTARLMRRDYVRALVQYKDREIYLGGLFVLAGFRQKAHKILKLSNATSSYSTRKRIILFINGITSFTIFPLVFISVFGMVITGISALFSIGILLQKIFGSASTDGWASLMVSIWFLGGLITFSVGIVGIYIAKIFTEVKDRPYTTIAKFWGGEA